MTDPRYVLPDFSEKREVDRVMAEADTHGVSRRDVLKLASAASLTIAASGFLAACGGGGSSSSGATSAASGGSTVIASDSGKLAFLIMTNQLEYDVLMDKAGAQVGKQFGYSYTGLNGELDAQLQLSQFNQVAANGTKAVMLHSPDGSNVRPISEAAESQKISWANVWGTLPWYTPFEAGDYWVLYAQPDEFLVQGEATKVLAEALGGKGNIVRVTGVQGNTADIIRSAGADAVLKEFPDIELQGELSGEWNSEASQKAMESLLSKYPDTQGVIAQNDDEATGVIAAIKAAGKVPGKDILVTGADGTDLAAERIKAGEQLVTTANVPAYGGYFLVTRLYDVQHGWKPKTGERMMQWKSIILTKDNIEPYLARYVESSEEPFNSKLLSHVESPKDWDQQVDMYPMDIDVLWTNIPKPPGYEYPAAYAQAKKSGEFDEVAAEYKSHYKADILGPVPS
ncbi:MAG: sugar ABC transporter substrate-binding protein [Solirubrobacterales bacterium]